MKDKIVESVIYKLRSRSQKGIEKYQTTLERTDLKKIDQLKHAQEEALDFANYLEVLIQKENTIEEEVMPKRLDYDVHLDASRGKNDEVVIVENIDTPPIESEETIKISEELLNEDDD